MTREQLHRPGMAARDTEGTAFPVDLCLGRQHQDSIPMRNPVVGLQDPLESADRALVPTCFSKALRGLPLQDLVK